jgi:cold shock CspA family protein
VARLNRPRRFGFLKADDGAEVFFHASALEMGPNGFDALRPGQPVEFDCHQDEQGRGLAATLVAVTGEPPEQPARPPRPPRAERAERPERPERAERAERQRTGKGAGANWHVVVLRERHESPLAAQLERLLNERNVKPGQFSLTFVDVGDAQACWVAYYTGEDRK